MKLRTKLLLGYAGFVLAVGVLGAWSARTLSQMSAVSRRMRLTLEAAGYQIGEAADGQARLDRFRDGAQYGAVVLDQKMPGLDGLETLARIKERMPDACVLMVTAFGSIELAVDAMRLGAASCIHCA